MVLSLNTMSEVTASHGDYSDSSHIPTFETIPIFNGGSGYWWILCAWKFWNSKKISESQRLNEVYHGLKGEALHWFMLWRLRNLSATWMQFENAFLHKYQLDFIPILLDLGLEIEDYQLVLPQHLSNNSGTTKSNKFHKQNSTSHIRISSTIKQYQHSDLEIEEAEIPENLDSILSITRLISENSARTTDPESTSLVIQQSVQLDPYTSIQNSINEGEDKVEPVSDDENCPYLFRDNFGRYNGTEDGTLAREEGDEIAESLSDLHQSRRDSEVPTKLETPSIGGGDNEHRDRDLSGSHVAYDVVPSDGEQNMRSRGAMKGRRNGDDAPRIAEHSTMADRARKVEGIDLQTRGFRRVYPVAAKPPPLLAAIFPWEVDSCDRIEKVAVMGVGFQGSDGGGRSILDVGGRLKLIGDDPWKLDGGGPCSVILSSRNNTHRKKVEQHLGMMEKTRVTHSGLGLVGWPMTPNFCYPILPFVDQAQTE